MQSFLKMLKGNLSQDKLFNTSLLCIYRTIQWYVLLIFCSIKEFNMKADRLDVNHIVACDQQTGVILRKNDDNSYYVELMNGEHKRMFLNEENVIPLSKKLLTKMGFIVGKPSMYECFSLNPLSERPMEESGIPYCVIVVDGKGYYFECGEWKESDFPIKTLNELQDYFWKESIAFDFSNQHVLCKISTMGMLTYSSKNPVGALTL